MTHLTARYAAAHGLPSGRVLGSGTTLDSARFRTLLGRHLGVDAQHIHGYVLGEHGDSEVLTWSLVSVGGMPLDDFCARQSVCLDDTFRDAINRQVRQAAYEIIQGKGATYYGIGAALAHIADAIIHDQRAILTVCAPLAEVEGITAVTLSLPRLLGGEGVLATFPPPLDDREKAALRISAQAMRKSISDVIAGE
jgi:L-lactate dehydrogenase